MTQINRERETEKERERQQKERIKGPLRNTLTHTQTHYKHTEAGKSVKYDSPTVKKVGVREAIL